MKRLHLFPRFLKIPGLILFVGGLSLFISDYEIPWLSMGPASSPKGLKEVLGSSDNYTLSLSLSAILLGLLFFGFSRLKQEDEMIAKIRLESLQWSIYITATALLLLNLFTFSITYITYSVWLWFVFLALYCVIFYLRVFSLSLLSKNPRHEE